MNQALEIALAEKQSARATAAAFFAARAAKRNSGRALALLEEAAAT